MVWLALVLLGLGLHMTDGWPQRFSPKAQHFDTARNDVSPKRALCHFSEGLPAAEKWCRLGAEHPDLALWSDSHGVELAAALAQSGLPLLQASYSACPPALGYHPKNRPDCAKHNQQVLDHLLATPEIKTVVMIGNYRAYDTAVFAALKDTITQLQAAGRQVILLDQIPSPAVDVPSHLAAGHESPFTPSESDSVGTKISASVPVLSMRALLCPEGPCPMVVGAMPLLFDSHHLSMTAALNIAPPLVQCLNALRQSPQLMPAKLSCEARLANEDPARAKEH